MKKTKIVVLVLVVTLMISVVIATSFGSAKIKLDDILYIIYNGVFGDASALPEVYLPINDIIWLLRLPRIILAACIGCGLAVCGVVMQAIVKNPLADPYILGISSGASLGATAAILLGIGVTLGENFVGIAAFIGAFLVSLLVVFIAVEQAQRN